MTKGTAVQAQLSKLEIEKQEAERLRKKQQEEARLKRAKEVAANR